MSSWELVWTVCVDVLGFILCRVSEPNWISGISGIIKLIRLDSWRGKGGVMRGGGEEMENVSKRAAERALLHRVRDE